MIGNIPGYFHVAQGVAPVRPATPSYEDGGSINIPGYDGGGLHDFLVGQVKGRDFGQRPGAPTGGGEPAPADPQSWIYSLIAADRGWYTADGDEDVMRARDLYKANPAPWDAYYGKMMGLTSSDGGGGSNDATAYAQIAENARQFDLARKDSQVSARQDAAVTREKMMQDYYSTLEAMKAAKKQAHNDAVTGALSAWSANVGQANIPGIENYDQFANPAGSSQILSNAPVLRFNPMEAYGRQQSQQTAIPTPNIPSPVFE